MVHVYYWKNLFSNCLRFYAAISIQWQPMLLIMYVRENWIQATAKINTREFDFIIYLHCRRYIGMIYIWLYCKLRFGSLAYLYHKNLLIEINSSVMQIHQNHLFNVPILRNYFIYTKFIGNVMFNIRSNTFMNIRVWIRDRRCIYRVPLWREFFITCFWVYIYL